MMGFHGIVRFTLLRQTPSMRSARHRPSTPAKAGARFLRMRGARPERIADGAAVNLLSAARETDMGYGAAFHENRVQIEPAHTRGGRREHS